MRVVRKCRGCPGRALAAFVWTLLAAGHASAQPGTEPGWQRFPPPFPELETTRPATLLDRPSASGRTVARLRPGTKVLVGALSDRWAQIRSTRGRPDAYVERAFLAPVSGRWPEPPRPTPTRAPAPAPRPSLPAPSPTARPSPTATPAAAATVTPTRKPADVRGPVFFPRRPTPARAAPAAAVAPTPDPTPAERPVPARAVTREPDAAEGRPPAEPESAPDGTESDTEPAAVQAGPTAAPDEPADERSLWGLLAGPLLLTAIVAAFVLFYFLQPTPKSADDYDRGIGHEPEPEPGGIGLWIAGALLGLLLFFVLAYFLSG